MLFIKPALFICKNNGSDKLCRNRAANQHLCFFLNPASSYLLWLYSPVCVGPSQEPQRQVFSYAAKIAIPKFAVFIQAHPLAASYAINELHHFIL